MNGDSDRDDLIKAAFVSGGCVAIGWLWDPWYSGSAMAKLFDLLLTWGGGFIFVGTLIQLYDGQPK